MRNLKRVLSLALALVMVLGMMVITTSAAKFTDADEITYTEAVDVMSALGVINGYEAADGTFYFDGDKLLSRAEGAALVCYMLMGKDAADKLVGSGQFTDVPADHWAAGEIDYCYNLKYIAGNGDGTFSPDGPLTTIGFGRMLLGALGYDGAIEGYTGENWASAISTDIIATSLDVDGVALDAQLTREQAAQMAFQALTATMVGYTGGMDITTGDTSIKVGATLYEKDNDARYDYSADATTHNEDTMEFCEYYFSNLEMKNASPDAYGRPAAYKWVLVPTTGPDKVIYTATATPVMSSTTVITADELYNTLGYNATIKATGSSYTHGNGTGANAYWKVGGAQTADYAVSDKDVNVGGNGVVTEIYKTANANEYIVVQIRAQLAKVGIPSNTPASNTEGAYTTYPVAIVGGATVNVVDYTTVVNAAHDKDTFTSDVALTKDAYVMIYGNSTVGYTITAADSVTGTLTSYNATKNQWTIDGTTYAKSAAFQTDITGNVGTKKVYFFDDYGYLAGVDSVAAADPNYAVLTQIALVSPDDTGAIGSSAAKYLEAELVFLDGTKEIVKVAMVNDAADQMSDATYDKYIAGGTTDGTNKIQNLDALGSLNTNLKEKIVEYTVNDKGAYTLKTLTQDVTGSSGNLVDTAQWLVDSTPATIAGAKIANNNTKFIVRTGDGNAVSPFKYAVYTGYANLPTKTFAANTVNVTGVYAANSTTLAGYVFVTGTPATGSADNRTQAFVYGAGTYNYVSSTEAYIEYPVIINGAVTTLKVATGSVVTGGTQPVAGTMYTINTLDAKGYVNGMTVAAGDTVVTAAKDGVIYLGTAGWKTYDEKTVVSLIDATAGTVTTADITSLNATGGISVSAVYVTYVKDARGNNTDVLAQVIAVKGPFV